MYTQLFSWKIETFEIVGFIPWYLREKDNNMSQTPQLGKNKYNYV